MDTLLGSTLFKVLLPSFAVGMMLFVANRRKFFFAADLGFKAPKIDVSIAFLLGWIFLIAIEEVLTSNLAEAHAKTWPQFPMHIVALRILAIGIIGPIAEELAFRGLLMSVIRKTRLGVLGAIMITAALWSAIHFGNPAPLVLLIMIDGIVLGAARHFSGSLWVPIGMHIGGNLFSIWQSLN